MNYFLGAYYLLKLKPLDFGEFKGQKILTGSRCLNESYFDTWSLSWAGDGKHNLSEAETEFGVTETEINEIQKWSDIKFRENHLGWINTFNDLETLIEYKTKFFNNTFDFDAIGIYFPENSLQDFIAEFETQSESIGEIGILTCLKQQKTEQSEGEEFVGYDLIGVEATGSYHSFQCYGNIEEIVDKFDLTLNHQGLINEFENKQALLKYANSPESGLPSVPWYLVKVKKVNPSIFENYTNHE